jgi:hypothetical protein
MIGAGYILVVSTQFLQADLIKLRCLPRKQY